MAPGLEIRMPSLPSAKSMKPSMPSMPSMPSLPNTKLSMPKRPQFGKIRSWSVGAGSKLSSSSSADKQDVASEIEVRKKGIEALYTSTEAYWSYIGKKKAVPFDVSSLPVDDTASVTSNGVSAKPEKKMLAVEALGLAMTGLSSTYPEDSAYGASLGLLGEVHIKLGHLQSIFTKDTSHIFLARIARSKAALDAFQASLKKLDTATARLESAQTKVQKSKKEKRELEEELRLAKAAYDEAVTDFEARGEAIQEAEYDDWQCLTTYMQAQLDYMGQAQAVLEQVKSMWGAAPAEPRSGPSTPASSRPRSLTGSSIKLRPSISRRSSAKEAGEVVTSPSSRFASRSSLSLSERPKSANDETKKEAKEKKNRLRMPSLSGAGDTVASVASGIGSFGRTTSSSLFGKSEASGETSPDKDKDSGPSKWNFMSRSKKEQGFMTMDESEKAHGFIADDRLQERSGRPPALPARNPVCASVSPADVHLGDHDETVNERQGASPQFRFSLTSTSSNPSSDDEDGDDRDSHRGHSPFSPSHSNNDFLDADHRRRSAHDTIHERGESQLSSDLNGLDHHDHFNSSHQQLSFNHTDMSAYSDNNDPFSSAMSPQGTGGRFTESEVETDEEEERTGLTSGSISGSSANIANAWKAGLKSLPGAGGLLNGNEGRVGGGVSPRGPPPPIPSSTNFLKNKRLAPPPPPPLRTRNSD